MKTVEKRQARHRPFAAAWLLAALLLLGQWAVLTHKLDLADHEAGHVCEWCVAHAGLDHAIAAVAAIAVASGSAAAPPVAAAPGVRLSPLAPYAARAPPVSRSV
jgi:hypothetical protein